MIRYPIWDRQKKIGITAPSSGVQKELHPMLWMAINYFKNQGQEVIVTPNVWTQEKAVSSSAYVRNNELNALLKNQEVSLIIPPWGGELLLEMLPLIDFDSLPTKWLLGYSDISGLLLAVTLKTGIATAHGTNFIDLRGTTMDDTTASYQTVLTTLPGKSVTQQSSSFYQSKWDFEKTNDSPFHLDTPTNWRHIDPTITSQHLEGRVLCGCIDIIRHLIGTPFGDVEAFWQEHIPDEPVLWVLENCELNSADLRRSLLQMHYTGWFKHCTGILFGRSNANEVFEDYHFIDVYQMLAEELQIPILYDIDCGHVPPQLTFINGAYLEVSYSNGHATVIQTFN